MNPKDNTNKCDCRGYSKPGERDWHGSCRCDAEIIAILKECIEGHKRLVPEFIEDGIQSERTRILKLIDRMKDTNFYDDSAERLGTAIRNRILGDVKTNIINSKGEV